MLIYAKLVFFSASVTLCICPSPPTAYFGPPALCLQNYLPSLPSLPSLPTSLLTLVLVLTSGPARGALEL